MARAIKQGQHIFIAFQDGEAVLDSQLRPRMYKSREQFEKSFPAWRDGKAELVEYAPTLTPPNEPPPCYQPDGDGCAYQCYDGDDEPIDKCKECPLCYSDKQRHHTPPNEPLTLEQLREMDGEPVWVTPLGFWALVISKRGQRVQLMCSDGETVWADKEIELVGPVYRRPPEGEDGDANHA